MKCFDANMPSAWEPTWSEDATQTLFDSPAELGRLGSKKSYDANFQRAFQLWHRRDQIRKDLALGGRDLLIGMVASLIVRQGGDLGSLRGEIAALGGDHLYRLVHDLIEEFSGTDPECHLWHELVPGQYALTV